MSLRNALFTAITLISALACSPLRAQEMASPLTLVHQEYLPDVVGDFDHLTVDLKRKHLFVTAEEHHSVEMFDLSTGKHLKSILGFKTPHSIAYAPEKDELLICDGGDSSLVLLSADTLERTGRVQLADGSATQMGDSPDAAYYDPTARLYYIGNGGASTKSETSKISIFSVEQGKLIGEMVVNGNNVEAMGVDASMHRLYVNVRDRKQIAVYDLNTRQIVTTWTTPNLNRNTALLVDQTGHRIFVAGRQPGTLYVFDPEGKVVQQLPCVERNDDMNWDPTAKLLYVSGSQGLSIYHQDTLDRYTEIARLPTNGGKTSLLVPQTGAFFVAHPKTDVDIAGMLMYRVNR